MISWVLNLFITSLLLTRAVNQLAFNLWPVWNKSICFNNPSIISFVDVKCNKFSTTVWTSSCTCLTWHQMIYRIPRTPVWWVLIYLDNSTMWFWIRLTSFGIMQSEIKQERWFIPWSHLLIRQLGRFLISSFLLHTVWIILYDSYYYCTWRLGVFDVLYISG